MNSWHTTNRPSETFFEVDIPLQHKTESAEGVALLVTGLLHTVDALAGDVGHDDVLQALKNTTAVRRAMADVSTKHGCDIPLKLLDAKVTAADFAVVRTA